MMATVPHVTSGLGLRKLQADGFLLTRVYIDRLMDYKNALNSLSLRQNERTYLWEQILTDFPRLGFCAMTWLLG